MLEELVGKYEEHRDKKHVNDLKLQRVYDIRGLLCAEQTFGYDEFDGASRRGLGVDGKWRTLRRRWRTGR